MDYDIIVNEPYIALWLKSERSVCVSFEWFKKTGENKKRFRNRKK